MASRPDLEKNRVAPSTDRSFFGHPRGLATLFFTEMWERFSYYGMRALLILFMTAPIDKGGLGFGVAKGGAVYGFYTAMVYLLCLAGGWVADRITGQRRSVLYGGILICAGEFCLATPSLATFYIGLVLLMAGTGLLKANVSVIVGQLYGPNDPRRDSGFSIFYMGINIGAFLSPLACGWVGQNISWRLGFGIAGIGMILGLVQYVLGYKHLGEAGLYPASTGDVAEDRRQKRNGAFTGIGVLAILGIFGALGAAGVIHFTVELAFDSLGYLLLGVSIAVFAWLIFGRGWTATERKRAIAILVLFIASAIFWAAFEQAGSSLNLFADRNTHCEILGFAFPSSWFQSVQPIFVIALSPVFAWLWLVLGRREPSSPAKFSMGLFFGGLAFLILVPAAQAAMHGVQVSPWWLTGCYLLQTIGELCLSPIGLSAMTKLAPECLGGFIMGLWFVSISIGDFLAGTAGSLFESMALPTLFGSVAAIALAACVVLALLVRPTVKMMAGVK
jgi:POT family proton-dependent oligopeptide transporter